MNKPAKTLTDAAVAALKPKARPYKVSDFKRLYVSVSPTGIRRWYWSFRLNEKDSSLPLGSFPDVNVEMARQKRVAAEKLVAAGIDPREHAEQQQQAQAKLDADTFAVLTQEWIGQNAPEPDDPNPHASGKWSHYYALQVRSTMGKYVVGAAIGARPMRSLTSADIFAMVRDVAHRKNGPKGTERKAKGAPSVAVLLKQWSAAVFDLAIASGRADNNAAAQFKISTAVKKPPVTNCKALEEPHLKALLLALSGYSVRKQGQKFGGQRDTAIAAELLCLFATRTAELRKARWEQFDVDNAIWTIPAENMKMKRPHVVPLSSQAIVLLDELRLINAPAADGTGWLFPNRRSVNSGCMSAMTINAMLVRLGFNGADTDTDFSAHGFRATFSTICNDREYARGEVIEAQLAHAPKDKIMAVYNKAKYLPERRALMQRWGDYVASLKTPKSEASQFDTVLAA